MLTSRCSYGWGGIESMLGTECMVGALYNGLECMPSSVTVLPDGRLCVKIASHLSCQSHS